VASSASGSRQQAVGGQGSAGGSGSLSPAPGVADGPTRDQRGGLGAEAHAGAAGLGREAAGGGLGPGEQALEGQGGGQRPVVQQGAVVDAAAATAAAAVRVVQASRRHLPRLRQLGQVFLHLCRVRKAIQVQSEKDKHANKIRSTIQN